ncbi:hypothetical protein [Arthrobacter globiformis]|uniref:hypothetical protein n=1 Tax=Arthrobacter globiformis TaxID=1665 RepID=UPI000B4131E8|nr:hypothetical protein [Arthrobacter globiformis]
MPLQKLHRNPAELDSLNLYASLGAGHRDSRRLDDPERVQEFISRVRDGVSASLSRPSTVYGWHAQNFFGALVAALDGVQMLKEEDAGTAYYAGTKIKIPDWSLILGDGRRLLVEVKSVGPKDTLKGLKISTGEVEGITRYATMMGCEAYLATYWSGMNMWSLVPLRKLAAAPGRKNIMLPVKSAMMWSEMSILGDRMLGVVPPLRLVIYPSNEVGKNQVINGEVNFTIAKVEKWCGNQLMQTKVENDLVMFLLLHSDWEEQEQVVLSEDGSRLESFGWTASPPARDPHQNFAVVGSLSSLYSSLYLSMTAHSGSVTSLAREPEVGMLPRLVPPGFRSPRLPLWHFIVSPQAEDSLGVVLDDATS